MPIYVSLLGIQYDEKYFPQPQKFIPERFLENVNKEQFIFVPFGDGPRRCIGKTHLNVIIVTKCQFSISSLIHVKLNNFRLYSL